MSECAVRSTVTFYMPTVETCDSDGNAHTITMRMSETPDRLVKHESVTVIYPKGKPETARLKRFASLWMMPLFAAARRLCLARSLAGICCGSRSPLLRWCCSCGGDTLATRDARQVEGARLESAA